MTIGQRQRSTSGRYRTAAVSHSTWTRSGSRLASAPGRRACAAGTCLAARRRRPRPGARSRPSPVGVAPDRRPAGAEPLLDPAVDARAIEALLQIALASGTHIALGVHPVHTVLPVD